MHSSEGSKVAVWAKLGFSVVLFLVLLELADVFVMPWIESLQAVRPPDGGKTRAEDYEQRQRDLIRYYRSTWRESSPHRYEHIPGSSATLKGVVYRYNDAGMREDRHFDPAPPPGVKRVAFVGDSVGHAFLVPREFGVAARTESLLLGKGLEVEVLNFSICGSETFDEYHVLKDRALRYSPAAVVLLVVLNDLQDSRCVVPLEGAGAVTQKAGEVLSRVPLVNRLADRVGRRATAAGALNTAVHRDVFEANVRAIADLVRKASLPLVVGVAPMNVPAPDAADTRALAEWVLATARRHGARTVDLWAAFAPYRWQELFPGPDDAFVYPLDYWHPLAKGHDLMAGALAQELASILVAKG